MPSADSDRMAQPSSTTGRMVWTIRPGTDGCAAYRGCDAAPAAPRSGGGGLRPGEPPGRVVELGERREARRQLPDAIEPRDAAELHDAVAEPLPLLVLAQLHVHPDEALEQPQQAGPVVPAALQRL